MRIRNLFCWLGIHFYTYSESVKGYGKQIIHCRGCTNYNCNATQFKEGNGKWKHKTQEKWEEFLNGIVNT